MEFKGHIFKDHEPHECSVETNDLSQINEQWYSFLITEKTTFYSGVFKTTESEEEHSFKVYVLDENKKIFLKSGTTIYIEADTKNDQCHYTVIRNGIKEEKKELIFQFKLP